MVAMYFCKSTAAAVQFAITSIRGYEKPHRITHSLILCSKAARAPNHNKRVVLPHDCVMSVLATYCDCSKYQLNYPALALLRQVAMRICNLPEMPFVMVMFQPTNHHAISNATQAMVHA
jgi:hypothetical protein